MKGTCKPQHLLLPDLPEILRSVRVSLLLFDDGETLFVWGP